LLIANAKELIQGKTRKVSEGGTAAAPIVSSMAAEGSFGSSEKSVLQTKLTKLAVQIGYAGKSTFDLDLSRDLNSNTSACHTLTCRVKY